MRDLNNEMNLRHAIYFALSKKQQRKLYDLGYCPIYNLTHISVEQFKKITKNTRLLEILLKLKRMSIRIIVA